MLLHMHIVRMIVSVNIVNNLEYRLFDFLYVFTYTILFSNLCILMMESNNFDFYNQDQENEGGGIIYKELNPEQCMH